MSYTLLRQRPMLYLSRRVDSAVAICPGNDVSIRELRLMWIDRFSGQSHIRILASIPMSLVDLIFRRPKPTRVAAVYGSQESALEAVAAAKGEGLADDEHVHVVGPLEQLLGNGPPARGRGSWAVIVEPDTYPQSKRIVRALRRPFGQRGERNRQSSATPKRTNSAAAGLVADRR